MPEQLIYVLSVLGFFRFFIYAIGEPHAEYNPKAILASYSYYLSVLRLKSLDISEDISQPTNVSKEEKILNREAKMSYVVERCKPLAGWSNALGLCPTCTSFWVLFAFVLIPTGSIELYGISLILSKIIIKWT
jgi:hypothetical protein